MTEYEYLDAISTYRTEVALHAMNFIGILFAYLVAGYFAAHVLSRFQAVAVTVFYLILSPMPAIAAYEDTQRGVYGSGTKTRRTSI